MYFFQKNMQNTIFDLFWCSASCADDPSDDPVTYLLYNRCQIDVATNIVVEFV